MLLPVHTRHRGATVVEFALVLPFLMFLFVMGDGTGGIMLYNRPASEANSDKVQITGNAAGTVDVGGLTSGPCAGMVLWQERSSAVEMLVEGNGHFSLRGTFYAAGARLNVNGNGKTAAGDATGYWIDSTGAKIDGSSRIGSQFIVNNLSLGGNGNVRLDYVNEYVARTRIITLVE
jgi:hypothetical protein